MTKEEEKNEELKDEDLEDAAGGGWGTGGPIIPRKSGQTTETNNDPTRKISDGNAQPLLG